MQKLESYSNDYGSDFLKAFKKYSVEKSACSEEIEDWYTSEMDSETDSEPNTEKGGITSTKASIINEISISLPNHIR